MTTFPSLYDKHSNSHSHSEKAAQHLFPTAGKTTIPKKKREET